MFNIERNVSEPYFDSEFKHGVAYINSERNEDLDAEGFAREIMRQVQSLRKKAGLQKQDQIELYIKTDKNLDKYKEDIKEKVGATSLEFAEPSKEYQQHGELSVKSEKFTVWFSKV